MKIILAVLLLVSTYQVQAQTNSTTASASDSVIYFKPEIEASYPGGINSWMRFLTKNLQYPDEAQSNEIQGMVVVQFIVDSAGLSHEITAISGPKELRKEAVRIFEKVKVWTPAENKGRKVNSVKTEPLVFKLESQ